jgi:adenylate kinase family enzyme
MDHPPAASPRVVVIGSSCAGKSTFAQALAHARGCPYVELDELFWGPDWTPKPADEFARLVTQATQGDAWVVAGNYSSVRDIVGPRATTIVWLDYGFARVLWRGLRRTLVRALSGAVLFHGNRESLRRAFLSRESILWWIITTWRPRRRAFAALSASRALRASGAYGHLVWWRVRRPREAAALHTETRAMEARP